MTAPGDRPAAAPGRAVTPAAHRAAPAPPGLDLGALFAPRSIAIVGASERNNLAQVVRDNLAGLGSGARCHFVNPRHSLLLDQPCHPTLADVPGPVDLVVIGLSPARVGDALREAAAVGARAAVIPGGGVVELGEAALAMQAEVRAIALAHGIAVLGPNCMGFVDYTTRTAAYIDDLNPWQRPGGLVGIAQSGSVTDALIHAPGARLGWARLVSCGSEVALDVTDFVAHALDDPATTGIVLFLEGLKRPERFLALADAALARDIPVIACKVGRSPQARAASLAHSGSLAGEDGALDAAFEAAGVIRVADLDGLVETAELVAGAHRLGRSIGRGRVGLVTVSTGEASLVADLAGPAGVELPALPQAAIERLAAQLPTLGYVGNPLDPWGATEAGPAYAAAFAAFADSGGFDVVGLVHDFPFRSLPAETALACELSDLLVGAVRDRPSVLPVYLSLTGGDPPPELEARLDAAGGIPLLRGARAAMDALGGLARWEARRARRREDGPRRAGWPDQARDRTVTLHASLGGPDGTRRRPSPPAGRRDLPGQPATDRAALPERDSLALLGAAGLPVVQAIAAADEDGALEAAAGLGWPVVAKLDAFGMAHKSDAGGVQLGIRNADELRAAVAGLLDRGRRTALRAADVRGVLIEPQVDGGVEMLAGVVRDPQVGPLVVVGLGGVQAEALADVALGLAPLDLPAALALLDRLRGRTILDGIRGRPPADRRAIAAFLVALGDLAWARPEILEIDCNPLIAGPDGCRVVDALVVIRA